MTTHEDGSPRRRRARRAGLMAAALGLAIITNMTSSAGPAAAGGPAFDIEPLDNPIIWAHRSWTGVSGGPPSGFGYEHLKVDVEGCAVGGVATITAGGHEFRVTVPAPEFRLHHRTLLTSDGGRYHAGHTVAEHDVVDPPKGWSPTGEPVTVRCVVPAGPVYALWGSGEVWQR